MRAPDFWARRDGSLRSTLLRPLGWAYGAAAGVRYAAVKPWKAPVPVLCVGNLVAGGAGKTPVSLSLGAHLAEFGVNIHFLTRGHGGGAPQPLRVDADRHSIKDVGDEALLLARSAPTWVSADRAIGARLAAAAGAGVIIMDDGFQNPGLFKDVSLLVIDGGYGLGNGRVIPAGPLRESLASGLARADALVLIGDDKNGVREQVGTSLPLLRARVKPGPEAAGLNGKDVVAFAGIGMPDKFFDTLRAAGCRLVACHPFPDHYPYEAEDIQRLKARARETGSILATTAKDAVRLSPEMREGIEVLTISMEWDDQTALASVLEPLVINGRYKPN
ncbi:MAG: tetraacyldisaccharide 4'-kinase [Rhodospirillales bacterium RIFCSPLOWO2_12_FULL_58_28]|nr:MAG: tetraacyldisaccharide 4'-kinase [Rhodospirillales bacterium RIFCSPLOWO2_02_FULL_58_16]OHC77219.1 MAG: tetraacyldisaccharide 4'-kinase [Rhodospirillales bacterium RIFCSPLOWO2_12_FULL_58_28]